MRNILEIVNGNANAEKYWDTLFSLGEATVRERRQMSDDEYDEITMRAAIAGRSDKEFVNDYYNVCQIMKGMLT